jgi:hypothetical protein
MEFIVPGAVWLLGDNILYIQQVTVIMAAL